MPDLFVASTFVLGVAVGSVMERWFTQRDDREEREKIEAMKQQFARHVGIEPEYVSVERTYQVGFTDGGYERYLHKMGMQAKEYPDGRRVTWPIGEEEPDHDTTYQA